jgi:tRNA(Arg) A34 adenosine deaminase TadA
MVTTLAPCWYCSGLIRQFRIPRVVIGENRHFQGGTAWLRDAGVEVVVVDSPECVALLDRFSRHLERRYRRRLTRLTAPTALAGCGALDRNRTDDLRFTRA